MKLKGALVVHQNVQMKNLVNGDFIVDMENAVMFVKSAPFINVMFLTEGMKNHLQGVLLKLVTCVLDSHTNTAKMTGTPCRFL